MTYCYVLFETDNQNTATLTMDPSGLEIYYLDDFEKAATLPCFLNV